MPADDPRPADIVHPRPPGQGEPASVREEYDALTDKSGRRA